MCVVPRAGPGRATIGDAASGKHGVTAQQLGTGQTTDGESPPGQRKRLSLTSANSTAFGFLHVSLSSYTIGSERWLAFSSELRKMTDSQT